MKLCPDCGRPLHAKHFCGAKVGPRSPIAVQRSTAAAEAKPMAKPMAKAVAKDMAKASSTYQYRDRERRRDYMRQYMRGYGCRWCRLPRDYFAQHSDSKSQDGYLKSNT
jgi:hypothetical protein